MAKRELSKCRVWERERRDRLKSCFTALGKLLPSYEPSSALSKTEILQRAATLIQELQTRNSELLGAGSGAAEAAAAELRRLGERVQRLLTRNEQLSTLLRQAGIRAPSECGTVTHFRQNRKWSSKIAPEAADNIVKKLNRVTRARPAQQPVSGISPGKKQKQKKHVGPKKKKSKLQGTPNENIDLNNKPVGGGKVKPGAATLPRRVYTSPSLGAGTLILADGSVLPVVPPPSTATVILVPRAIACRPGPGAKVAIPPLRSRPQLPTKPAPTTKRKKRQKEQKSKITKLSIVSKISRTKPEVKKESDVKPSEKVEMVVKPLPPPEPDKPEGQGEPVPVEQSEAKSLETEKQASSVPPEQIGVTEEKPQEAVKEAIIKESPAPPPPPPAIEAFTFSAGGGQQAPAKAVEEVATAAVTPQDHCELSNDIFASLAVPGGGHSAGGGGGGHHPESMSPTAAFLLAFPLVSTLTGAGGAQRAGAPDAAAEETSDTPTLLQIGAMDGGATSAIRPTPQETGSGLLALDTFTSFFSAAAAVQRVEAPTASFFASTKATEDGVSGKKPPLVPPPAAEKQQQYSHTQQCNTFNPFSDVPPTYGGSTYGEFGGFQEAAASIADCSKTKPVQQQQTFSAGYQLNQQHASTNKRVAVAASRPPVNWMTTPDTRHPQPPPDLAFPPAPPPEFNHGGGANIFSGSQWSAGGGDGSGYREEEANRWSWSPGRLLPPLLGGGHEQISAPTVPATLPTLVGDLALGPGVTAVPEEPPPSSTSRRAMPTHRSGRKQPPHHASAYDMSGFSVSQLVKESGARRTHGGKSSVVAASGSRHQHHAPAPPSVAKRKPDASCYRQGGGKWQPPADTKRYKLSSNNSGVAPSSNYTAEALIGHTDSRVQQMFHPQQQYPGAAGQYQSHQPPPPAQSYLQQEYPPPPAFPVYSGAGGSYTSAAPGYTQGGGGRQCVAPRSRSGARTRRHHHSGAVPATDVPVPPYVDLSFLSSLAPGAVGSPATEAVDTGGGGFAPPPPLYYGRHYGGAGSPTTANTSSLTNFNLSTIFPEMGATGNKAPLPPPQSSFPFTNS